MYTVVLLCICFIAVICKLCEEFKWPLTSVTTGDLVTLDINRLGF